MTAASKIRAKNELAIRQSKLVGNQPRCCEYCGGRGFVKSQHLLPYEIVTDELKQYHFWLHGQCAARLRESPKASQVNLMIELAAFYYPTGYKES